MKCTVNSLYLQNLKSLLYFIYTWMYASSYCSYLECVTLLICEYCLYFQTSSCHGTTNVPCLRIYQKKEQGLARPSFWLTE